MMKKHSTTIALIVLFFAGIIGLKLADMAAIPTAEQLRQSSGLVFPGLKDVPEGDITRVEVLQHPEGGDRRLVFERKGEAWQIIEPVDTAADSPRLDALVQNLKSLRASPEAGTIRKESANFGLKTPRATILAFKKGEPTALARLDIGKASRDRVYVRAGEDAGIEVVESRIFQGVDKPVVDWRDRSLFNIPTFQVLGFKITTPKQTVDAERRQNQWKLTQPFNAPGNDTKIEETLAELTSLQVAAGEKGFVADNVKDYKPYGLDEGATKVELFTAKGPTQPYVVYIGKASPDEPTRRFARRGDQDDVILVEGKELNGLGLDPYKFRGQKVADLSPSLVDRLEIKVSGRDFTLSRTANGWVLLSPTQEMADADTIPRLLSTLADLQASEFLGAESVPQPELDPPLITVKAWQGKPGSPLPKEPIAKRDDPPAVDLKLGRHDALRKSIYGRIGEEPAILAIPDTFLKELPSDSFAYRNRQVVDLNPPEVSRLVVERDGQELTLERGLSNDPNRWKMTAPVEASADNESITKILLILSKLTAQRFVADNLDKAREYGLDNPSVTVRWTISPNGMPTASEGSQTKTLRIGSRVPKQDALYYANLLGSPMVFTVLEGAAIPFHEEFRSRQVVSFPMKQVDRVTLTWPDQTLAFGHHPTPRGGPQDWNPLPGSEKPSFDLSRVDSLVNDLSRFRTRKFMQYKGPFPKGTGLDKPRLTLRVDLVKGTKPLFLRVGEPMNAEEFYATVDQGDAGTVFLLSGSGWPDLLKPPVKVLELPKDVFAPVPK
ncbi:DUF4340 domain-containing protein [Singulisphaera sp. PoT]|uniref:DUF4340 domain-containing protein n=1 Tax=Singulisphaera sp. PoT TaxID=3411797 RepID=UPI003BF60ED2